jgi:hypothetical protein
MSCMASFADSLLFQNITKVQVTESRVFALSAFGKVYVIPAQAASQDVALVPLSAPWWGMGRLWGEETGVPRAEIVPAQKLVWDGR